MNSQVIVDAFVNKILSRKNILMNEEDKKFLGGKSIQEYINWIKSKQGHPLTKLQKAIYKIQFILFWLPKIKPFPASISVLKYLKKYDLIIVSNSQENYLRYVLKRNKMDNYFSLIVTPSKGTPKPSTSMLRYALRKNNLQPDECVIVDDNEPGITAGNKLGMYTIKIGEGKTKAKKKITNIEELKKIDFTRL